MSDQQQRKLEYHWGALVAQAWADESYKAKLLNNPASALAERGFAVPSNVELKVVEDGTGVEVAGNVIRLPLPAKPDTTEFSSEEICYDNILQYANGCNCNDKCNCVC